MQNKVSVIVPVYNIENYIQECVESIQRQTFDNLEILLVNDGSADGSGELCEQFQKQDNRIRVIHQKNGGLACAVNTGLKNATGDFILFVDGDDWIYPFAVEYALHLLQRERADIVIYDFTSDFDFAQDDEYLETTDNVGALRNLYLQNSQFHNLRLMTTVRWSKLYKREVLEGIVFPEGRIHEDEIVHEILYKAKKVVYTNKKCYFYRQREGSIIHEAISTKALDKLQSFKERVQFFEDLNNQELLFLAVNKFVFLYIQLFCKCELVENGEEQRSFLLKLNDYGTWIQQYKVFFGKKAKAEMSIYSISPGLLRKIYWMMHRGNK